MGKHTNKYIFILLCILVCILMIYITCTKTPSTTATSKDMQIGKGIPILWVSGSLYTSYDCGTTINQYPLYDKSGAIISSAIIAVWHDKIVYWSAHDRDICVKSTNKSHWLNLTTHLPVKMGNVENITTTNNELYLNIVSDDYSVNEGVLAVNPSNDAVKRINDILNIQVRDSSFIGIDYNRNIVIGNIQKGFLKVTGHYKCHISLNSYDYDVNGKLLAILTTDDRIVLCDLINSQRIVIHLPSVVGPVVIEPNNKQIWIVTETFDDYKHNYVDRILVYDYHGRYIGERLILEHNGFIHRPILNCNQNLLSTLNAIK